MRKLINLELMISSDRFAIDLVVMDKFSVKEGVQAGFQIFTPCDFQVKNKERFIGYADLFATLNAKLIAHDASKDLTNQ